MTDYHLVRTERAISQLKITTLKETPIWRDLYWLPLPAIPRGSLMQGHLILQLENPSDFPTNIAWLREFAITTPDGAAYSMWATPGQSNGQLGMNITREMHYFSHPESFVWRSIVDIPAGSRIAYRGRAQTSTVAGFYMQVWDKGRFDVFINCPPTHPIYVPPTYPIYV